MGAACIPCGVGGMEVAGHVLVPLVGGMTSLVLNRDGAASMGVWGHGFPRAGAAVYSVRQCLPPLVAGGGPARLWVTSVPGERCWAAAS